MSRTEQTCDLMTIMENRIMALVYCDRQKANLVANEVLNLLEWERRNDHGKDN